MDLTLDAIYAMAPFARTLGVTFPEISTEAVVAELPLTDALSTIGGTLHGGAVMSVCDLAAAVVVGVDLPDGSSWTTAESTSYFLRPVTGGARARAVPVRRGRGLTTVSVDVTDVDGTLCARTMQLVAVRTPSAA